MSDESGQREIYLQAFPQGGNKRRVSVTGGIAPRWRADGKDRFYVEGETLMATPDPTDLCGPTATSSDLKCRPNQ